MARLVKFTKNKPLKLETNEGVKFICQCGLSKKFPFCDGNHKKTIDEKENEIYIYSEDIRIKI